MVALSVMETQLPAEASSVASRIHRNQVSQNLLSPSRRSRLHSRPPALAPQLSHMTLCFTDIIRRHHAAQTAFRQRSKALIGRQLHIGESGAQDEGRHIRTRLSVHLLVDKEATDEELEQLLDRQSLSVFLSHVGSDDITAAAVMSWAANRSPRPPQASPTLSADAAAQIGARQQDLVRLEASIGHLQQLFADVAALLDAQVSLKPRQSGEPGLRKPSAASFQGELVNNIEKNVTSAAEYVGQSREETRKAVWYKKNPTKVASLPGFLKPARKRSGLQAPQERPEPERT